MHVSINNTRCDAVETIPDLRLTSPLATCTTSLCRTRRYGHRQVEKQPPSPGGACADTLCYVTWCCPRRTSEMFLCLAYQFCMILQVTKKHFHPSETPLCGYNAAMLGMLGVTPRSLFLIPRQVHFFWKSCSSAVT